jgi:hypothetical protein
VLTNPSIRLLCVLAALLMLAACGSVSKLQTESSQHRRDIRDFSRVEVLDFAVSATSDATDDEKQAKFLAQVSEASVTFADLIAEQLRERDAHDEVSREPLEGPALRVTGTITRFEQGNVAARMVSGFVGQAHFEAEVIVSDNSDGRVLGSFKVDRNSWPLPIGASSNAVQNTGTFMSGAAKRIGEELAKARGK